MREAPEMGFFAVLGEDGEPRVMHSVIERDENGGKILPADSVPISEAEAHEIGQAMRAREAQQKMTPAPAAEPGETAAPPAVDLEPIKEAIAALVAAMEEQNKRLETAEAKINAVHETTLEVFDKLERGRQ